MVKMAEHRRITEELGFDTQIQSLVEGLSAGGIFIMWKEDSVNMNNIFLTPQGIHVMVKVSNLPNSWLFSAIYASTIFNENCLMGQSS